MWSGPLKNDRSNQKNISEHCYLKPAIRLCFSNDNNVLTKTADRNFTNKKHWRSGRDSNPRPPA